jgi:hypothetical protein
MNAENFPTTKAQVMQSVIAQQFAAPERNDFGAIEWDAAPLEARQLAETIVKMVGFRVGVIKINGGKGWLAGNYDLYGYDIERKLVALQFRQTWKRKDSYTFSNQRKGYVLAGIDDGQLFSHVVPSSYRTMRGIDDATPGDVVRWAESKIFGMPVARLETIIRQGDIALVPVRAIPAKASPADDQTGLTLRNSHKVTIDGSFSRPKTSAAAAVGSKAWLRLSICPASTKPSMPMAVLKSCLACAERSISSLRTPLTKRFDAASSAPGLAA